jgi:beta-lactamase regulating signal transducer with metallopeptidase domain
MDVSFFVQMGWKSALIAGAALGLAYVLRSRAASDRAMVLRIGVTMLLLLPLAALALPSLNIVAFSAPEAPAAAAMAPAPAIAPETAAAYTYVPGPEALPSAVQAVDPQPAASPSIWDDPTPLVFLAYLGGLLMVGGRLLLGLFMLRRWTKGARDVTDPDWLAAFARVRGADDRTRLMVSDAVPSPLSWGWRRPVILIDPDTLDEPEEADAILAHEMAHVARRDWVALMLTRVAAAAFWFNPIVWLLEREIVQQAEEAADCEAAAHVEPARYAQTLLTWAQVNGGVFAANSIAPKHSALGRRIRAILDRRERPSGTAWARIAALTCIGLAAPIAAVQLVQAAQPTPPEAPAAPAPAPLAPPAPHALPAPGAPAAPPAPPAPLADIDIPDVTSEVHAALAEVLPHIPEIVAASLSAVDPEEIDRQVQEALREGNVEVRHMSRAERERVRSEVRRAMQQVREQMARARADMARARADMGRVRAEMASQAPRIAVAMQEARRAAAAAPQAIAIAMRSGSVGMAHGAEGMERGAQRMEEQARRFRDRSYREQVIARERARGHNVTHEDLLEAASGMEEGARGMRDGAREMREAARRMGDGDTD